MLDFLNQKFQGKKTYSAAIVAVLSALLTYFSGDATLISALQLALTGVLAAALRYGVASDTGV